MTIRPRNAVPPGLGGPGGAAEHARVLPADRGDVTVLADLSPALAVVVGERGLEIVERVNARP